LVKQELGNRLAALRDPLPGPAGSVARAIRWVKRVGAQLLEGHAASGVIDESADHRPAQLSHVVCTFDPKPRRRRGSRLVSAWFHVKRPDEAEMDVEDDVVEIDEEVLSSGRCRLEDPPVDERGISGEPALRT